MKINTAKKIVSALAVILVLSVLTAGCGGKKLPALSGSEAREAFADASVITFSADYDDIKISADIIADGYKVGKMKEAGMFDPSIRYIVDGEDIAYVKFITDGRADKEGVACSSTYGCYDMDDNCLGYMQDRDLEPEIQGSGYTAIFMDPDLNLTNCYIKLNSDNIYGEWARTGVSIYGRRGDKLGYIEFQVDSMAFHTYTVTIDLGALGGSLTEIQKVALCWRCMNEMAKVFDGIS